MPSVCELRQISHGNRLKPRCRKRRMPSRHARAIEARTQALGNSLFTPRRCRRRLRSRLMSPSHRARRVVADRFIR